MARKTEKGGKFRNVHCRTWNMGTKYTSISMLVSKSVFPLGVCTYIRMLQKLGEPINFIL